MKLIGSTSSPYVRKVRIVMAEKKLDYDFVNEDVWAADTMIGQSNPLGKVPCLVMEGGEALFDSRVIVEYLDTLSPVGKLIPAVGRERAEVKTWEALADGVLDAAHPRAAGGKLARARQGAAQPGLDRPATLQGACQPQGDEPGPGRKALLRRHLPEPGRYRGRAARWATWTSASPTSTGAAATPTWPSCTKSSCSARASSTASRPEPFAGPSQETPFAHGADRHENAGCCRRFAFENKNAAKRPETKEGGREEEKSRSRIATGLTAPGRLRSNNRKIL